MRESAEQSPRKAPRSSLYSRMGGVLLTVLMLLATVGGTVITYRQGQSAESENALAINAFDLQGAVRQIAGNLQLPNSEQTASLGKDTQSLIIAARQSIGSVRSHGTLSPLVKQAIGRTTAYLDSAESDIKAHTSDTPKQIRSADSLGDLIDEVATEAQGSAHAASFDERTGGIAILLLVLVLVVAGVLWQGRQRRHSALIASKAEGLAEFEAMIENSSDHFFLTDSVNRMRYCSPSAARFFGLSAEEVCDTPFDQLIRADDLVKSTDAFDTVMAVGTAGPFDLRVRHHDGGWRTIEVMANDLVLASSGHAVVWHTRDVTDRRALEEQLTRQAFEDPLTGLANRALFRDRLGHALSRLSRSTRSIAVLMLDLDGFKAINDSMGHDAGDEALKEIAARISGAARPGDTVGRLGGDEFTILLEELDDPTFADEVADRILELVRQPLLVQNVNLRVSASIGIVVSGAHEMTPEELMRDADIAMYRAKADGRDRRVAFEPAMHASATKQLRISQDLAHALDRDELALYYQAIVDLEGGTPQGVEALIRWHHHDLGLVAPNDFISIAEQNGLILPIGRWVLEQACAQAVAWHSGSPEKQKLTMSVNVSGRQLNHDSLVPDVRRILADSGLDPQYLILEVTESVVMSDIDMVIKRLKELKELGISIAIDDFGTGYSSLAYLRQLPVDILKIDKAFIDAAASGDPGGDAIMRAIVHLSEGLHLKTIAEGVEDADQALHIKELGCQSAQGFLFSRPMPPDEIGVFLAASTRMAIRS
jgi:diguanylate cyclase (GGDEF)-like protein/PAS domain S-box-containing protein